jgi:hypothetical protein
LPNAIQIPELPDENFNLGENDTTPGPYENQQVIAETDSLKVSVIRTFHRAQKIFPFEDHMYIVQFLKKTNKPILLNDIQNILYQTFLAILTNLKNFFEDEKERLIYMTINQKNFTTGVRTSVHVLADCDVKKMTEKVMSDFNRFLNSNQSLELDSTFKIYFKVLSEVHVHYAKNRRRAIPIRHRAGAGRNASIRLKGSLISLPIGYPNEPLAFLNKCVFINLIFGWLKYHNPSQFDVLKTLTFAKRNNQEKNAAGVLLTTLVNDFCTKCNVANSGPNLLEEIVPIFSQYSGMQIHIIRSTSFIGKKAKVFSYPTGNDYTLQRIYFYEQRVNAENELQNQNENFHLYFIEKIGTFFKSNKRGICFDCKQTFNCEFENRHVCKTAEICYKCKGLFQSEKTVIHPHETVIFCDSKMISNCVTSYLSCYTCNQTFNGPQCFQNHLSLCQKNIYGWKCTLCEKFIKNKKSAAENKAAHKCGTYSKKCQFCYEVKDDNHICLIPNQFDHREWPNLAFLTMKFKSTSSGNCNECFIKKSEFASKNNLTFKDLFFHKDYKTLFCSNHVSQSTYSDCNIINLYWEETGRFDFTEYLFFDDPLKFDSTNTMHFKYAKTHKLQTFDLLKSRKRSNSSKNIHCYALKERLGTTAMSKFLHFITQKKMSNTTFIVPSNKVMTCILKFLLLTFCNPDVVQKGSQLFVIEVPVFKCRFLNFAHYLKGSIFDIGSQMCVNFEKIFFPESWNQTVNYFYNDQIPQLCDYYLFNDTPNLKEEKKKFYSTLEYPWNFQNQIFFSTKNECSVFTNSCLNFLQLCFQLQVKIANCTKQINVIQEAIHPFGAQICSLSSFTMAIFKYYFYNQATYKIYSVMAPYNGTCTKSSKGEYEFFSYLCYTRPELKLRTAFNHPKGQINFGKYFVDAYSPVTKTVYQYRGCRVNIKVS